MRPCSACVRGNDRRQGFTQDELFPIVIRDWGAPSCGEQFGGLALVAFFASTRVRECCGIRDHRVSVELSTSGMYVVANKRLVNSGLLALVAQAMGVHNMN